MRFSTVRPAALASALVAALAATLALPSPTAHACEPMPCAGGLFPADGPVLHIPPNAPGIPFWPASPATPGVVDAVAIERQSGATWTPEAVLTQAISEPGSLLLIAPKPAAQAAPTAPWVPSSTYRLTPKSTCQYQRGRTGPRQVVVAAEPAPLPTGATLALIALPPLHGPLGVATWHGSCANEVSAQSVRVFAGLPPVAQPWADLLIWTTKVDDSIWQASAALGDGPPPGVSWVGRGRDLVYTVCAKERETGLAPGRHTVTLSARILGTDIVLTSNPVSVTLVCP